MAVSLVRNWPLVKNNNTSGVASAAGETIVVSVVARTTAPSITLGDNGGNSYTEIHSSGSYARLYYCTNADPASSVAVSVVGGEVVQLGVWILGGVDSTNPIADQQVATESSAMSFGPAEVTPSVAGSAVFGIIGLFVSNRTIVQRVSGYDFINDYMGGQITTHAVINSSPSAGTATGPYWDITSGNASGGSVVTVAFNPAEPGSGGGGDPVDPGDGLEFTLANGWQTLTGGSNRLSIINDGNDATYVSSAGDPVADRLTLGLPAIAPPVEDFEVPLRLSSTNGSILISPELFHPDTSSWLPAADLVVSGSSPAYYTAIWPVANLATLTESHWLSQLDIRLTATARTAPLLHRVTATGAQPIYLGVVTPTGVETGLTPAARAARIHGGFVVGQATDPGGDTGGSNPDPDPDPEPAEGLGTVGNRPAVAVAPSAVDTGPRQSITQTLGAYEARDAILAAPVEADGKRYLRRTRVNGMLRLNDPSHHSIVFEDCVFDGGMSAYAINSFSSGGPPAGDMPEFRYCEIRNASSACVYSAHARYLRCDIHYGTDLTKPSGPGEFYANYLHDLYHPDGGHCDAVQIVSGCNGLLIHWNNMQAFNDPGSPSGGGGTSNAVLQTGSVTRDIGPVYWNDNWFDGGHYTIRGVNDVSPVVTYIFRRNKFGRNNRYGPLAAMGAPTIDFDSSNVWQDDGQPV